MSFDIFKYLTSLAFIYVYGRFVIHFAPVIFFYFLNTPTSLQRQVEKPRLLFYLIGLGLMHMFSFSDIFLGSNIFLKVLALTVFTLGVFFCHLTWTEKFIIFFAPQVNKKREEYSENFNLSISNLHLNQLYNELVKFDLLNQNLTSFPDFKNVLLNNWNDHESKIYLNMDGPSCREFYNLLVKSFPNNSLTLKKFTSSKLFIRTDGRLYKYNTLKNAPVKTTYSKNYKALQQVFDKI